MRTFKLTLAYRGTHYFGWQSQAGQVTLQGTLERALQKITGEAIRTVASGRTDTGVHALGQVVSFRSDTALPPDVLVKALNAELPPDMAVLDAAEAPEDFHAISSAKRKRYRYRFDDGPVRDVFAAEYSWHIYPTLDAEAMHEAAQLLVGEHDFSSFESSGSPRDSSVRTVYDLSVRRGQGGQERSVTLEIEANGFLYHMVRSIAGTLVEVGRDKQPKQWMAQVLAARARSAAGRTAPAHGLCLVHVIYE